MRHWIFTQFSLPDGEPEPEETHELSPTRVPLFCVVANEQKQRRKLETNKKTPLEIKD